MEDCGTPQNVSTPKTPNDDLAKELEFLRSENNLLKGRLRGCDTLGSLLQEARKVNRKLEEEKQKLKQRLDDSLNDEEKHNMTSSEVITSLSDITRIYNPNGRNTPLSIPMQESIPIEATDTNEEPETPSLTVGGHVQSELEKNIEYDSIKADEPNYPETEGATKAKMGSFSDFSNLMTVSSLASSATNDDHPILRPSAYNTGGTISDFDFRSMTESIGDEAFSQNMQHWMANVIKIQGERTQFKNVTRILSAENGQLKTEIAELREENSKLLQKIKYLEHDRDNLSPGSFQHEENWVHVPKANMKETDKPQTATDTVKIMREVKCLKEANTAWREKWNSLERSYSSKCTGLEASLAASKQEMKDLQTRHKKQEEEMDKMVLQSKSKCEEIEEAKQEVEKDLHLTKQEVRKLQTEISKLNSEVSKFNRTKSMLETELNAMKNGKSVTNNSRTNQEKDTEIMVLKEQVALFHEDFEKERQDRAATQAMKNQLQEENQQLKSDKTSYNRELQLKEQQLQQLNMTRRHLLSDTESKSNEIQTLKSEIQRLKMLASQQQYHLANPRPQQPNYEAARGYRGYNVSREVSEPTFEHLPGTWTCDKCTYINFPGRTVCEICGEMRETHGPTMPGFPGQRVQDLTSRGRTELNQRDVEVDTVM